MKTIFPAAFFIVAITFTECATEGTFLKASVEGIEFSAEPTGEQTVTIDASSSWMVEFAGLEEWLSVEYDDSDANVLRLSAGINESPEGRDDSVVVVSGDGLSLILPIVQRAMGGYFDVTPAVLQTFGARETAIRTLTIDTNMTTWEASVLHDSDWILLSPEDNTLGVGVKPTRLLDARRDTIVLRPMNEAFASLADSVAVVQRGLDLLVSSEAMDETTLETAVPAGGGEVFLTVYSRNTWSVTTDDSAGRVTLDISSGPAEIEYGTPLVVTATENTGPEEYTFTLTFSSGGETYEYLCRQPGNAEI
jgi:hypothetical protein